MMKSNWKDYGSSRDCRANLNCEEKQYNKIYRSNEKEDNSTKL